ncbi:MAG: imelysin family protein [Bacteroidota bacterium]
MNLRRCLLLICVLSLLGCEMSEQQLFEQRSLQLKNLSDFGAVPLHDAFQKACKQFSEQVNAFAEDTSQDKLNEVQQQWKVVGQLFKRCELYDFGEVNSSFIHFRIHRWPTNERRLEDSLQTTTTLTAEGVSNMGSALLGLAALEHLLFEKDPTQSLLQFQENPRRLQFLVLSTEYLSIKAGELNEIWKNYSPTFTDALQSAISGGQNQLTNSLIAYLEETMKSRLGKALGESNGGLVDKTELEAHRSGASLDFLKSGFEEWKHCFNGDFEGNSDAYGFDDYLKAMGNQALADRIQIAIQECDQAMAELSVLQQDLENDTEKVANLKKAFHKLSVLTKNDLAGFIGVTVTANDSDGD